MKRLLSTTKSDGNTCLWPCVSTVIDHKKSSMRKSHRREKFSTISGVVCHAVNSDDLKQGSSNNSVTNFVLGFSYIFQRETQPSFEELLLVVLMIPRRRYVTRF